MEASSGIDFGVSYFRHMPTVRDKTHSRERGREEVRVDVIYPAGTLQQCSSTYYVCIRIRNASTFLMHSQKTRSLDGETGSATGTVIQQIVIIIPGRSDAPGSWCNTQAVHSSSSELRQRHRCCLSMLCTCTSVSFLAVMIPGTRFAGTLHTAVPQYNSSSIDTIWCGDVLQVRGT